MGDQSGKSYRGVRDTGDNTIEITFWYQDVRHRVRMPWKPNPYNLARADKYRSATLVAIEKGEFTFKEWYPGSKEAREEVIPGIGLELGTAIDKALALCLKAVSRETHATYVREGEFWKVQLGEHTQIKTITKNAVQEVVVARDIGVKRTVNLLIPLRKAFEYAVTEEVLSLNPLDSLKITHVVDDADAAHDESAERADPFLYSEVQVLSKAEYTGDIWVLWSETGLRGQELSALLRSEVSANSIYIKRAMRLGRVKKPKTLSSIRHVPLSPRARAALDRLLARNPDHPNVLVNPHTGAPYSGDRPLRTAFQRDCLMLGVKYKEPRLLRHSFASWALEAGESPLWVARVMGHKTVEEVMKVYARHIPKNIETHGAKLWAALAAGAELGVGFKQNAASHY
jgi:integrase